MEAVFFIGIAVVFVTILIIAGFLVRRSADQKRKAIARKRRNKKRR